jgi:hypothetical protein
MIEIASVPSQHRRRNRGSRKAEKAEAAARTWLDKDNDERISGLDRRWQTAGSPGEMSFAVASDKNIANNDVQNHKYIEDFHAPSSNFADELCQAGLERIGVGINSVARFSSLPDVNATDLQACDLSSNTGNDESATTSVTGNDDISDRTSSTRTGKPTQSNRLRKQIETMTTIFETRWPHKKAELEDAIRAATANAWQTPPERLMNRALEHPGRPCVGGRPCVDWTKKGACRFGVECDYCHAHDPLPGMNPALTGRLKEKKKALMRLIQEHEDAEAPQVQPREDFLRKALSIFPPPDDSLE